MKDMLVYVLLTAFCFLLMQSLPDTWPTWQRLGINTLLILLFAAHIVYHDLPLKHLPFVGKYFR